MVRSILILSLLVLASTVAPLAAQEGSTGTEWDEPVQVSRSTYVSWFPDLAVDRQENVHLTWCYSIDRVAEDIEEDWERLRYTVGSGGEWAEPNEIVPPTEPIIRHALAIDGDDTLHLVYRHFIPGHFTGLYYIQAPAADAWSARSWSEPRLVSARGRNYAADLAVDSQGVLHLVFEDEGDEESEECPSCSDTFYRRSSDGGRTWSEPINLVPTSSAGAFRYQIEVDRRDVLHVTWDEGWDRLSGDGEADYSVYVSSPDGGRTWSDPKLVTDPGSGTALLAPGADGRGGVMLVWRVKSRQDNAYHYQWSPDNGAAWSGSTAIPGLFAPLAWDDFDMIDMATDSAGTIHLVVAGRLAEDSESPEGIYHLTWDGEAWSAPEAVYQQEDFPQYPRLVIHHGNQLQVAWFTRPDRAERAGYEVWTSQGESPAPFRVSPPTTVPEATPTPESTTADGSNSESATPFPTIGAATQPPVDRLYTESDEVLQLGIGLGLVLMLLIVVFLIRRQLRHWRL
jgi:hypothetical protein